jgi:hypothetical protein
MNGFISYSHEDYRMFREFKIHLSAVERAFAIDFWADTRIRAGYHWSTAIEAAINAADVFVLLATPGFIASNYIYDKEIPAIKARRLTSKALVVPVVLKRCSWQMISDVLQAVPTDNGILVPVDDWKPRRNGFDLARAQTMTSIESYFGLTAKTVAWNTP